MPQSQSPATILLAEDDPDDRMLITRAFGKSKLASDVRTVADGEELMAYLKRTGGYADENESPRPKLILLDLNMPRKSGREALREIKADPKLRSIPVVVLTTSEAEADIVESYDTGANAYVTKPIRFEDLVSAMETLDRFWFNIVKLPADAAG